MQLKEDLEGSKFEMDQLNYKLEQEIQRSKDLIDEIQNMNQNFQKEGEVNDK